VSGEPENLVLEHLRVLRAEVGEIKSVMATKADLAELRAELRSEMQSLRADVASDLAVVNAKVDTVRKELGEQLVGLRRAVVEYHSTVIGHGVLISELEGRVRRIEQHLNLPAPDAH